MKNILHVFGCSYTADYNGSEPNYISYKNWRNGNLPLTWPEILSLKLNYELKNYGIPAIGNQRIFREFCNHSNLIKKGDMVIIQWSYFHRYDWANPIAEEFFTLGVGDITNEDFMLRTTHQDILINRTLQPYRDEIISFMNLINTFSESLGFDLFFWSGDYDFIYGDEKIINEFGKKIILGNDLIKGESPFDLVFQMGGETIAQETKNVINDGHLGESGHKIKAEIFYNHIIKYYEK